MTFSRPKPTPSRLTTLNGDWTCSTIPIVLHKQLFSLSNFDRFPQDLAPKGGRDRLRTPFVCNHIVLSALFTFLWLWFSRFLPCHPSVHDKREPEQREEGLSRICMYVYSKDIVLHYSGPSRIIHHGEGLSSCYDYQKGSLLLKTPFLRSIQAFLWTGPKLYSTPLFTEPLYVKFYVVTRLSFLRVFHGLR